MPDRQPDDELFAAALRGVNECPPLKELECLLSRDEPRLQRHVDRCPHCQTELQMLRSFTANELAEHESTAVNAIAARLTSQASRITKPRNAMEERRSWWKPILAMPWLTPAAATIAVALLVAGVALELRQAKQPELNTRMGGSAVLRSSSIAILSPAGDLREKPVEVRWEAAPNAVRYRVRMMEVDRTEVWSAETAGTRIPVPSAVGTRILPMKTFVLRVEAFDSTGGVVGESEPVRFRLLQKIHTP